MPKQADDGAYTPSPEKIKEECQRIQKTWSPRQEQMRRCAKDRSIPWELLYYTIFSCQRDAQGFIFNRIEGF